ncbi:CAP domain-containing protein [Haliangium ochraceum]|uniref:SCP-like extracellular n=1 Tax=Haliangium ochraceum (strain DSM 14365 / JCM 11303 / SMP-2) TaxID=502025 RepID=D0LTZ5_HALO1|nr:CAP domain-containing protein [Haliangium ochraceum]ACY17359.1 SCP-like extracellular [Haliangium ochraceum DSM 14365]
MKYLAYSLLMACAAVAGCAGPAPEPHEPGPAPAAGSVTSEPIADQVYDDRGAAAQPASPGPAPANPAAPAAQPPSPAPAPTPAPTPAPATPPTPIPPAAADGDGAAAGMSPLERGIVAEMNRMRRAPRAYAADLSRYRSYYQGALLRLPGQEIPIQTFEGPKAVDEAIAVAKRTKPLPELRLSAGLSRAARAHAEELGAAGTLDHTGRDGSSPFQRMARHGTIMGMAGENIGTAHEDPSIMVLDLFVDDGVQNRGHRENLLSSRYHVVGVGCAPHRRFGTVCVIDYAEGFSDK